MIFIDDCLLPHNIIFPLSIGMHDIRHFLIISGVLSNSIREHLTVIGHYMPLLSEDYTNSILEGICLNLKWLLQVWQGEDKCRAKAVFRFNECLLL